MKNLKKLAILSSLIVATATIAITPSVTLAAKDKDSVSSLVKNASGKNPLIFSHRGTPDNQPEHSYAGYNEAIKNGSKFIEQDVWLSKDNILYVSHDNNLKRTTGKNINISESTSDELKNVKLRNGESIHKLSDVFKKYKKTTHYIIESKKGDGELDNTEDQLAKTLNKYKMNSNVIIQDSDLDALKQLHKKDEQKNVPTLWLMEASSESDYLIQLEHAPKFLTFISLDQEQYTDKIAKKAHDRGFKTNIYTVATYNDNYNAIKQNKVDSLFTNNTKETMKFVK
ncbi:glycerophosphodiester phosphodiesterase [Lactobacillus terrae]|uniref:glycerophosphodiester phosphodiesterase n=1 Tax=Lactobacillus terrae TaxID=2269374 RepID=UPI000C1B72DF|nr:glycerophosphodiester phosphodiesterase [Lactobacillus terrae]